MTISADDKLYIITLKYGSMRKRLYLAGPAGPEGEEEFKAALKKVGPIGDAAEDYLPFVAGVIKMFHKHGFIQTAK